MSIEYCEEHNHGWDNNEFFKCPQCVLESVTKAPESATPSGQAEFDLLCVAECVHCGDLYQCGSFNEKEWLANECLECDGPLRARIVKEYKPE